MRLLLPLSIDNENIQINTPYEIYQDKKISVWFTQTTLAEKEWIFGLKDLQIGKKLPNGFIVEDYFSYSGKSERSSFSNNHTKYLLSNWRIECEINEEFLKNEDFFTLQTNIDLIDFLSKLIWGNGIIIGRFKGFAMDAFYNYDLFIKSSSKRVGLTLTVDSLNLFKDLLCSIKKQKEERVKLISFYFRNALLDQNQDIAGAFYISILESIFVPDKDSEIGYRFALRIAKYFKRDKNYFKLLKELYNKRSAIYHGTGKTFVEKDLLELERLTSDAIISFLKTPDFFSDNSKLDDLVIS